MSSQILNVPYLSHAGRAANAKKRSDCGACCVAMLLGAMGRQVSAKNVVAKSGRAGEPLSPRGILRGAQALGLSLFEGKDFSLADLKHFLDQGQPPIALVKYGAIPDRQERRLTGGHYVLVVGYDDTTGEVFIHDPHYPRGSLEGCQRACSYRTFLDAWAKPSGFSLIVPSLAQPVALVVVPVPEPQPLPAPVSFGPPAGLGDAWVIAPAGLLFRSQPDVPPGPGATGVFFGQHLTLLSPESAPDDKGRVWQQVSTDQGAVGWAPASVGGERYLATAQPAEPYTVQVLDTQPVHNAGGLSVRESRDIESSRLEKVQIGDALVVYYRVTEADGTPWLWVKSPGRNYGWVREKADGVTLVGVATLAATPPQDKPAVSAPSTADGFLLSLPQVRQSSLAPATPLTVPPGGSTAAAKTAAIWNRFGGLLEPLASMLSIDPAVAVAVVATESGGRGMGDDGRMIIRFEAHVFWSYGGKNNPDAFNALFKFDANKVWLGHQCRPNPNAPWQSFHDQLQAGEWSAFGVAQGLDDRAAKLSISMGLPQIMGFNFAAIGYNSVEEMFDAFSADERIQLSGFFDFVRGKRAASPRMAALQSKDFSSFAAQYNGGGQVELYSGRIQSYCDAFHTLI